MKDPPFHAAPPPVHRPAPPPPTTKLPPQVTFLRLGLRKQATNKSQRLKPLPVSILPAGQMLNWVQAHPRAPGPSSRSSPQAGLGLWDQRCCCGPRTSDPRLARSPPSLLRSHLAGCLSRAGSGLPASSGPSAVGGWGPPQMALLFLWTYPGAGARSRAFALPQRSWSSVLGSQSSRLSSRHPNRGQFGRGLSPLTCENASALNKVDSARRLPPFWCDVVLVGAWQPLALQHCPVPAQHPPSRESVSHLSGTWTSMWSLGFLVLRVL